MMYPILSPDDPTRREAYGMILGSASSVKDPCDAQTSRGMNELVKEPDMDRVPAHHLSVGN